MLFPYHCHYNSCLSVVHELQKFKILFSFWLELTLITQFFYYFSFSPSNKKKHQPSLFISSKPMLNVCWIQYVSLHNSTLTVLLYLSCKLIELLFLILGTIELLLRSKSTNLQFCMTFLYWFENIFSVSIIQ